MRAAPSAQASRQCERSAASSRGTRGVSQGLLVSGVSGHPVKERIHHNVSTLRLSPLTFRNPLRLVGLPGPLQVPVAQDAQEQEGARPAKPHKPLRGVGGRVKLEARTALVAVRTHDARARTDRTLYSMLGVRTRRCGLTRGACGTGAEHPRSRDRESDAARQRSFSAADSGRAHRIFCSSWRGGRITTVGLRSRINRWPRAWPRAREYGQQEPRRRRCNSVA
jgi:hypothetical protein